MTFRFSTAPAGLAKSVLFYSATSAMAIAAAAQTAAPQAGGLTPLQVLQQRVNQPRLVVPIGVQLSELYADASIIEIQTEDRWRFVCGSVLQGETIEDLRRIREAHEAELAGGPAVIVDSGTRGGSINVVYNLGASVPTAAVAAFGLAETYVESQFGDPISFTVSCSFANMGQGVIGATGSTYATNITWTNSRNGLVNGMDADDTIQSFLPTGSTMPVRYTAGSATITNQASLDWTVANYRSTVGTVAGNAATMQFNNQFTFDWDPSNGVNGTSFVDVVLHETGHAMGFTSNVDSGTNDMDSLDIYRFASADGTGTDYNPDTRAEFQTTPRLVDQNVASNSEVFSADATSVQYLMSDTSPWQASHFNEGMIPAAIMDPAFAAGQTYFPNYFRVPDRTMFDAIGYDYPPCTPPTLTEQPQPQSVCLGGTFSLSVATNGASPTYQWRRGGTNLSDGGRISGATSAMLTITGFVLADSGNYDCLVTVSGCAATSDEALVTQLAGANFLQQPPEAPSVPAGTQLVLSVSVENPLSYSYQWFKNNNPVVNNPRISGATTQVLTIDPTRMNDIGIFRCEATAVGGGCSPTSSDSSFVNVFCDGPDITQQPPVSQTICVGDPATFTVASNAVTPSYQWRRGGAALTDGPNISGATTATLTVLSVTAGDAATDYACEVTDTVSACNASSNDAALVVDPNCGSPCPADLNNSGAIDLGDLATLLANFGTASGATPEQGDLDNDDDVDLADLAGLLAVFGTTCP